MSLPEQDFYNRDLFGDIRWNPNNTCGGPLMLWRSHNTYDRTYEKTFIVRSVQDPDIEALSVGNDPVLSFSEDNPLSAEVSSEGNISDITETL